MSTLDVSDPNVPRQLLDAARGVLTDMDLDSVLERVLEAARATCSARYAALGLLDESRQGLARFITSGIDEETRRQIGAPPRGRGVLGELIKRPTPLRLANVSHHPHSYGFPAGHPPMTSFLGVPVELNGAPFGNLYLTDKIGAEEFTEADERSLVLLATFAGVAIDHARQYSRVQEQREELERTVAALDATVQIARAVGGETDLGVILELVAKRGRALVSARALVIELERGGELFAAAAAGEVPSDLLGRRIDSGGGGSVAGLALRRLSTLRLEDEPNLRRFQQHGLGRLGFSAEGGLVVPLIFRSQPLGALIAVDRLERGPSFSDEDRVLLESFAVSAATAVATARSVEAERRAERLAAIELERGRWARELHDETLQNLAAMRLTLSAQLRTDDLSAVKAALTDSLRALDGEIATLRSLIHELRPTALDDLGLEAALEDLIGRVRARGLQVELDVELSQTLPPERPGQASATATAIYRIVQEALTNATKHGSASRALVRLREEGDSIVARIRDDGTGFDPHVPTSGFGLKSMRERAELAGGVLTVVSAPGEGTTVTVRVPSVRAQQAIAS